MFKICDALDVNANNAKDILILCSVEFGCGLVKLVYNRMNNFFTVEH